jgi:hypothetical protein
VIRFAVVCPGAPLLVPGLAPGLAAVASEWVAASREAVSVLAATDRVVVLSTGRGGLGTVVLGPGSPIAAAPLARSDVPAAPDVTLPGGAEPTAPTPPATAVPSASPAPEPGGVSRGVAARPGTIVAAHLLAAAGITIPTTAVELDPAGDDPARQVRSVLGDLDGTVPTGLLVIADGAASHGPSAPGAEDPGAAEFDARLRGLLSSGDPVGLAAFCRDPHARAAALRCETLPGFAALAGLTRDRPPESAVVDQYGAPFGVGYIVARWQWHSTG